MVFLLRLADLRPFLPADAVAERRARGRPKSVRDLDHHAHKAKRADHQRQSRLHAEILHPVLHQVHKVRARDAASAHVMAQTHEEELPKAVASLFPQLFHSQIYQLHIQVQTHQHGGSRAGELRLGVSSAPAASRC